MNVHRTPYSFEDLKTFGHNFRELAKAKEGERGRIEVNVDAKTGKKTYKVVIDYQAPATYWGKVYQGLQRTVYGHHSDDFFNQLKELFADAKLCIEDMQHETNAKKSKRLYRLKESVQGSQTALSHLVDCYVTGKSNRNPIASPQTESQPHDQQPKPKTPREKLAEETQTIFKDLSLHVQHRVAQVVTASEAGAEIQTLELMKLLFPPHRDPDPFVINFHTNASIQFLNKKESKPLFQNISVHP